MALKITKLLADDIDGSTASRTAAFTFDGVSYEIDLSDENYGQLQRALEPYVAVARRVGGRRSVRKGGGAANKTTQIREWAAANGYPIADRGRIPADIINAYEGAHA